jgi:hypothetical protein
MSIIKDRRQVAGTRQARTHTHTSLQGSVTGWTKYGSRNIDPIPLQCLYINNTALHQSSLHFLVLSVLKQHNS